MKLPSVGANMWLGDSAATSHMRNSLDGMFDLKPCQKLVKVGNGDPLHVKMIGKWQGEILQKNGEKRRILLDNVNYAPRLCANLFSIT